MEETALRMVDPGRPTLPIEGNTCALHSYHSPSPKYFEVHHIVPQSWTNHAYFMGGLSTADNAALLNMKAILCRTGHGNVHYYMVELTTLITKAGLDLYRAFMSIKAPQDRAAVMARNGIQIAQSYDMDIAVLYAAGLRGQI